MMSQTRKVTIKHGKSAQRFAVKDLSDWQPVAERLASLVESGSVVTLQGPLGAGKTTLVQYLARTLGAPKRATSPTFALIRVYRVTGTKKKEERGKRTFPSPFSLLPSSSPVVRLVHVDAYRIEDEKDLIALDLDEELLEPGTVVLVEWPENIPEWLKTKKSIAVKISV